MDLSALLGHGRENAVSSDFLAAQLQTSTRGLRDKILKARCNGEIILYAPGGWGCLWGRRTLKAIYEPKAFKAYLQTPLLVCWHN